MKRRSYTDGIDYLRHTKKRAKLATYLKTGSFKKIGGTRTVENRKRIRRALIYAAAALIIIVGSVSVIL